MNGQPTVSDAVADALADAGIGSAFGLMGEDTVALADCLQREHGIPYYGVRHENVAVGMAEGFGWAADRLGLCILSRGPGLLNGVGGALAASRGGRRLVIVIGDTPTVPVPTPDLKRLEIERLTEELELGYVRVGSGPDAGAATRAAIRTALTDRPCVLGIPTDLFHAPVEAGSSGKAEELPTAKAGAPADEVLEPVVELLKAAETPLILAGWGAVGDESRRLLVELAERSGSLLATTLVAKDLFRGHPNDFGVVGGFTPDHRRGLLDKVDFVLAVGASLSSYTTAQGRLFRDIPLIQVNSDAAALGANHPIHTGLQGDSAATARRLLELFGAGEARLSPAAVETLAEPFPSEDESGADGVDPRALTAALAELLPVDRTMVVDGGHFMSFPVERIRVDGPTRFRHTSALAAIGQGLGVAMGIAVARPESTTILFIGDGGMLMTLGDLETVKRYRLPLTTVVMNDRAFGAERHLLDIYGLPNELAKFPDTDFAALAAALDIESATVRRLADLDSVVAKLRGQGEPLLLDCKILPDLRASWIDEVAGNV
jgi:thiamine pyrophosphate-dependent acetolactate synthase large subunit-like protein